MTSTSSPSFALISILYTVVILVACILPAASEPSTTSAPPPAGTRGHTAVLANNTLFIQGGTLSDGTLSKASYAIIFGADKSLKNAIWLDTTKLSAFTPRSSGVAVASNGAMITCGTQDGGNTAMTCDRFDVVWYNKTTFEPIGTQNRFGMAAAYQKTTSGVKAFFIGGSTTDNQIVPTTDVVPSVDTAAASNWGKSTNMLSPVWYSTATWVGSPVNGIVVLGGLIPGFTVGFLEDAFVYHAVNSSWTSTRLGNDTYSRYGHSAVNDGNGNIYIFGGIDTHGVLQKELYVIDTKQQSWSLKKVSSAPEGRAFHTATMLPDNTMLIMWGQNGNTPGTAQPTYMVYNFGKRTWTTGSFPALKSILESPNTPKQATNGTSGSNPSDGQTDSGDEPNNPSDGLNSSGTELKPPTNSTRIFVIAVASVVLVIVIIILVVYRHRLKHVGRTRPGSDAEDVKEQDLPISGFREEERPSWTKAGMPYGPPPPGFHPSNNGQYSVDAASNYPQLPQPGQHPRRKQHGVARGPRHVADTQEPRYSAGSRAPPPYQHPRRQQHDMAQDLRCVTDAQDPRYGSNSRAHRFDEHPPGLEHGTDLRGPQRDADPLMFPYDVDPRAPQSGERSPIPRVPQRDADPLMFPYDVDPRAPQSGERSPIPRNEVDSRGPQHGEQIPAPLYEADTRAPQSGERSPIPLCDVDHRAPQFGEHAQFPQYGADPRAPQYGKHAPVRCHEVDPRAPQFGTDPGAGFRYSVAIRAPHRVKTIFGTENTGSLFRIAKS